ncbi:MAG: hypothetical protein R3F55_00405 [Alphaproteobacteria bacterium]
MAMRSSDIAASPGRPAGRAVIRHAAAAAPCALLALLAVYAAIRLAIAPAPTPLDLPFWALAPGLAAAALARPAALRPLARGLWLGGVLSPPLVAAALLVAVWGLGLDLPRTLAWGHALALAGLGAGAARLALAGTRPASAAAAHRFGLGTAAAVLVFAALIAVAYLEPSNRLSVHGVFHGNHIGQIAAGLVPPDNPAFAGRPALNYWAYHLLYAFLAEASGRPYTTVSAFCQVVCFALFVAGMRLSVAAFVERQRTAATLLAGFGLNLLGPVTLALAAAGHLGDGAWWTLGNVLGGLGGPLLSPQVHAGIFVKFLSFNGFVFGLAGYAALLAFAARGQPGRAAAALLAMVLLHPQTALFAAATVGAGWLWRLLAWDPRAGSLGAAVRAMPVRRTVTVVAALVLPFVAALPYILSFAGSGAEAGIVAIAPNAFSAVNFPLLYLVPLPLALIGFVRGWRRPTQALRFLQAGFVVALLLALLVAMPWNAQYKYLYLACPFVWLLAIHGLRGLLPPRWSDRAVALCAAATLATMAAIGLAWAALPSWFAGRAATAADDRLVFVQAQAQSAALAVGRATLPTDTVVVEDAGYCENSYVGAVAGLRSYFVPCYVFTAFYADRPAREQRIAAIFADPPRLDLLAAVAAELHAPVALLVARDQLGDRFAAVRDAALAGPDLMPVYESDDAALFRLLPADADTRP